MLNQSYLGKYNFLLITLDSCRFDSYRDANTPNLDWYCKVRQVDAPGYFTLPSHAAILRGHFPSSFRQHGYYNRSECKLFTIKGAAPCAIIKEGHSGISFRHIEACNIPEGFQKSGYHTIGIGGVRWFDPEEKTTNFLREGFNDFWYDLDKGGTGQVNSLENQIAALNKLLDANKGDLNNKLKFVFMNISLTHHPYVYARQYNAPPDNRRAQVKCVEHFDHMFPQIIKLIPGPLFIIICGDHGDNFGEDGLWIHQMPHPILYKVPMLVFELRGSTQNNPCFEPHPKRKVVRTATERTMNEKITYENQGGTAVGLGKYYLSPGGTVSLAPEDPLVKEAKTINGLVRVSGMVQYRDRRRLYKSKDENPYPFGTNIKYIVALKINHGCNFNCAECFYGESGEKSKVEQARTYTPTPEELAKSLGFLAPSIIYITGGEPLLYKGFADCCGEMAAKNLIGFVSNLSAYSVLRDTLNTVGAESFFAVGGSLHIGELERLNKTEEFFKSLELLVNSNVPTFVIYNVRRELESKLDYYIERVKGYGVPVFGKYLQGRGGAVEIDYAYKKAEGAGINMSWFKPYDIGWGACPQMKCGAGAVSLNIDGLDGRIQKCIYDPDDMGNIFTGEFNPTINSFCAEHCYCHPYLFLPRFSDRYDNWGEFRELVRPNTTKAHVI